MAACDTCFHKDVCASFALCGCQYYHKEPLRYQWIPVTEQMPEDSYTPGDKVMQIKVLVCNINNGSKSIRTLTRQRDLWWAIVDGVGKQKWGWRWSRGVLDKEITHWMPLPELPEVE